VDRYAPACLRTPDACYHIRHHDPLGTQGPRCHEPGLSRPAPPRFRTIVALKMLGWTPQILIVFAALTSRWICGCSLESFIVRGAWKAKVQADRSGNRVDQIMHQVHILSCVSPTGREIFISTNATRSVLRGALQPESMYAGCRVPRSEVTTICIHESSLPSWI